MFSGGRSLGSRTTFFLLAFVVALPVLLGASDAYSGQATLIWNANTEPDLAGYKLYYGTASRTYQFSVDVGNQISYVLSGLLEGQIYYFAVTAYDSSSNESAYSSEVNLTIADVTPPVISAVAASVLTSSGASLTWTTNEASNSQVEYGLTIAYGSSTTLNTSLVTSHLTTLSGLAASTAYHYRVKSRDAAGNLATSGDLTFTTLAAPDLTPPTVSMTAPAAGAIVSGTLTVAASASDNVGVVGVQFKLDGANLGAEDTLAPYAVAWNTTTVPNGPHTLSAVARDAAGNVSTAAGVSVTVANDTTPPLLSGVTASSITISGTTISWTTDETSDSQVEYGATTAYGSATTLNGSLLTSHVVTLGGLAANTLYHFRVRSRDAAGNLAVSGDFTFTTLTPDLTAPAVSITAPVAGATVAGIVTVAANATDNVGVVGVQFQLDGSPLGAEATLAPYAVSWDTITLSDGTHSLTAVARDLAGNTTTSATVSVTVANGSVRLSPQDTSLGLNATNYSGQTTLTTYTWPDNQVANAILMKFDLSGIPAGAVVQAATLYLALVQSDGAPEATYTVTAHKMVGKNPVIAAATGYTADGLTSWTPNACCYTNVPLAQADISPAYDTRAIDKTSGYKSWTITTMVQEWLANPATNFGLLLNSDPSKLRDRYRYFASMEHPDSTIRPFLHITYALPRSLDRTPPTVSVTTPAAGATVAGIVTIAANASDDVGVAGVQFQLDGSPLGAEATVAPYVVAWNTTAASQGTHTLTALARDAAGNVGTAAGVIVTVANDTTPPLLSGVTASSTTSSGTTISWTTDEASDSQVEYGPTTAYGSSTAVNTSLVTSHLVTLGGLAETSLYHFRVRSRDAAGNLATSADFTFATLDGTPPAVSIAAPTAGATVSGTVTVVASATDNVGVVGVQFKLDGANLGAEATLAPYAVSWNTTAVPNGLHTLSAVARDAAGNISTAAGVSVTVANDTTPPLLSEVTASSITISGATISWTTDEASDSQVEYGTKKAYGSASTLNGSLLTSHVVPLGGLAANTLYHFRVRSRDAAGNLATSADFTFTTLDGTPPTVSIAAPAAGATVAGIVTVAANATDNVGVAGVQFQLDGASLGAEAQVAPYVLNWDTTTVSDGTHTLTAVARDLAGNTMTSATVSVTVANGSVRLSPQDTSLVLNATNYSTDTRLMTYTWSDYQVANAILMKFDLSGIPAGAVVQSATLYLALVQSDGAPETTYTVTAHKMVGKNPVIAAATGYTADGLTSWTPNACCYTNVPLAQADISPAYDTQAIDKTPGYKSWTITTMVQEWLANSTTNFGLLLNADLSKLRDRYRYFASMEHPDSTIRPFLHITYALPPTLDPTPPTVSITAPAAGATVSGIVTIAANATDNVGVAGVQFQLDGASLGAEAQVAPYVLNWDTTTVSDGTHTLAARARDAAGNTTTSATVSVTVANGSFQVSLSPQDTSLGLNATNYSGQTTLTTYTWPDNQVANAILMKFDLSAIPAGAVVQAATLHLALVQSDGAPETYMVTAHKMVGKNPVIAAATGYTADGVTSWTPNACCYANVPLAQADISPAYDTQAIDKTPGDKSWTITTMVQEWLANPATNFGLLLNSDPSKLRDRYRYFASMEHPNAQLRPYLRVTYSVATSAFSPASAPVVALREVAGPLPLAETVFVAMPLLPSVPGSSGGHGEGVVAGGGARPAVTRAWFGISCLGRVSESPRQIALSQGILAVPLVWRRGMAAESAHSESS